MGNEFEGLSSLTSTATSSISEPLTIESLQQAFDTIRSEEYYQREAQQQQFAVKGLRLLTKAHQQGILTDTEYQYLWGTIAINSGLIVPPSMHELLSKCRCGRL